MATQNYGTSPGRRASVPAAAPTQQRAPIIASAMGSPMAQTRKRMQKQKQMQKQTQMQAQTRAQTTPAQPVQKVPAMTNNASAAAAMARKKITF